MKIHIYKGRKKFEFITLLKNTEGNFVSAKSRCLDSSVYITQSRKVSNDSYLYFYFFYILHSYIETMEDILLSDIFFKVMTYTAKKIINSIILKLVNHNCISK